MAERTELENLRKLRRKTDPYMSDRVSMGQTSQISGELAVGELSLSSSWKRDDRLGCCLACVMSCLRDLHSSLLLRAGSD